MNDYWIAIKENNTEDLDAILQNAPEQINASINSNPWQLEPQDSYTHQTKAIHICSFAGREQLLKILLKYNPDLEAITFEDNKGLTTPLVLAAWEGSLESCELLLKAGANPNTCASAESPLYAAAEHHAWDKVECLLKYGAKHDIFTASICGEVDIVVAEIKAYPPLLDRRSLKRNRTPLEEAIEHQQEDVISLIEELPQTPS